MINIEVRGHTRITNRLTQLAARSSSLIDKVLGREADIIADELTGEPYAPPPSGSRYIRTGRLGRGYDAKRTGAGSYSIINTVPYSGYVVDAQTQAAVHRGRWWTVQEIINRRQRRKRIGQAIVTEFKGFINGTG